VHLWSVIKAGFFLFAVVSKLVMEPNEAPVPGKTLTSTMQAPQGSAHRLAELKQKAGCMFVCAHTCFYIPCCFSLHGGAGNGRTLPFKHNSLFEVHNLLLFAPSIYNKCAYFAPFFPVCLMLSTKHVQWSYVRNPLVCGCSLMSQPIATCSQFT
jgi:hypothetical protein